MTISYETLSYGQSSAAGIEFIPENGGGPGVRLRKVEAHSPGRTLRELSYTSDPPKIRRFDATRVSPGHDRA